ncbi:AAA family ATPase [Arthrobacter sp. NEB 688]|uniref:AAA family ATPase n=1 Tax=Arthrobacter sp. NEB 688 TaxID=904039 RepID=UPI001C20B80F|nr:AAA family ATPase [Arthrobacter sp. NEB 688]
MEELEQIRGDAATVASATAAARTGLVDREVLVDVVVLCAVAREHVLVVGPPGTAKSEAIRRVARHLGESYFEYLIGRFTEPNEIFGPIDLTALRDGVVRVETSGMLPEAELVFLDEVFLGSTAILNTLLGLLNEREYRRGSTHVHSPLRTCVGACNVLPEDPSLAAFADRFLAHVFVDPVPDARLEELLELGWQGDAHQSEASPSSMAAELDRLSAAARSVELVDVVPLVGTAVRTLRTAGILLSDRRVVRAQRLVAAASVLDGRVRADQRDLWVLPLIAPTADAQALASEVLAELISSSSNLGLPHAAEAFSHGPAARAARMRNAALDLLADEHAADRALRAEALLREIDASFGPETLPADLAEIRSELASALPEMAGEPEAR